MENPPFYDTNKQLYFKVSYFFMALQGEHLVVEVFMEPPRKHYPLSVYSGGG
jgi:hypothetical protein